jgi:hypothetical protein
MPSLSALAWLAQLDSHAQKFLICPRTPPKASTTSRDGFSQTTIKVFIDVFIGIWAFILAYIWTNYINVQEGDKAKTSEIWQRFPKFIIGFVLTFLIGLYLATTVKSSYNRQQHGGTR